MRSGDNLAISVPRVMQALCNSQASCLAVAFDVLKWVGSRAMPPTELEGTQHLSFEWPGPQRGGSGLSVNTIPLVYAVD